MIWPKSRQITPCSGHASDRPGEFACGKRFEVVDLLADADEIDRQSVLGGDRHQNTAARRAVQLGHHQAVDAGDVAEDLDLAQRILAGGGVDRLQHGVRGLRIELAQHADDLFQFRHQLGLVLQAAGGVDDQHVGAGLFRLLEGIISEAGGVGAELAGDDRRLGALAPDLQLLNRGSAEGVAGRPHHPTPAFGQLGRQLADGRRLAGAVDADDQDDVRLVAEVELERLGDRGQDFFDFRGHHRADFRIGNIFAVTAGGERVGDAQRRLDAEIGADQHILQVLKRVLVQLAFGEDAGDVAGELARGTGKPVPHALEPGTPRRRLGRLLRLGLLLDLFGNRHIAGRWRGFWPGGRRRGWYRRRLYLPLDGGGPEHSSGVVTSISVGAVTPPRHFVATLPIEGRVGRRRFFLLPVTGRGEGAGRRMRGSADLRGWSRRRWSRGWPLHRRRRLGGHLAWRRWHLDW